MGCIIETKVKGISIDLNQENKSIISQSSKKSLSNKTLFQKLSTDLISNDNKSKSLFFQRKNTSFNNLINIKTNNSTYLNPSSELILTFSNEFNQNYDKISIFQNTLTNLINEDIKIIKEDILHSIFSFGGKYEKKYENIDSNSFDSSNYSEKEEIDYLFEENNIQSHQFDIEYDEGKYYIKGHENGTGIFYKIDKQILIQTQQKYIFLFNYSSFINFQINKESNIVIIEYNGDLKGEFNYKIKPIILIGRNKNCDIILSNRDEGISRIQFTFFYNEINDQFYVYDGFYSKEDNKSKSSTNGIWLLINQKMYINKNMKFKTGKTVIFCEIKEN